MMGNRGRFGKYGETKRHNRLRQPRIKPPLPRGSDAKSIVRESSSKASIHQKAPLEIRPAKTSDSSFITHLSGKVFNIYGAYDDIVSDWFESERTFTLIALLGRKPAGFAMIGQVANREHLEHVFEVLAIAVVPENQRTGIGQMLLRDVERKATELNVKRLFLHTAEENLSAQKLFLKNGYHPWGMEQGFYPAGQDALLMSKEIGEKVGSRKP